MPPESNGWDHWKNHVLQELNDNRDDHRGINKKLDVLTVSMAEHCAKADTTLRMAKVWASFLAATIGPLTYFLLQHFLGH